MEIKKTTGEYLYIQDQSMFLLYALKETVLLLTHKKRGVLKTNETDL